MDHLEYVKFSSAYWSERTKNTHVVAPLIRVLKVLTRDNLV